MWLGKLRFFKVILLPKGAKPKLFNVWHNDFKADKEGGASWWRVSFTDRPGL